jgi:hypothetical protein
VIVQVAHPPQMVAIHCAPITDTARAPNGQVVAGRYFLVVEAKQKVAQGPLQLWPTPSTGDSARTPLYGATSIDLRPIGLHLDSARLASRDPVSPGVLVYEANGSPTTVMIGAGRNGEALMLSVRQFRAGGFSGWWKSVGNGAPDWGRFCAFAALNRSP